VLVLCGERWLFRPANSLQAPQAGLQDVCWSAPSACPRPLPGTPPRAALTPAPAPARARRPTPGRQFRAVLRKNLLLQARGGRALCGLGGGPALALEVLTPALFFLVMCLPKAYLPVTPTRLPAHFFPSASLDSPAWARAYAGAPRAPPGIVPLHARWRCSQRQGAVHLHVLTLPARPVVCSAFACMPACAPGAARPPALARAAGCVSMPLWGKSGDLCASRCRAERVPARVSAVVTPARLPAGAPLDADLEQSTGQTAAACSAAPDAETSPGAQVRPVPQARRACCLRPTRRPRRPRWRAAWRRPRRARRPPPARAASTRCSAAGPGRSARMRPAAWRRPRAGRACSGARSSATRARRAPRPGHTPLPLT
jgi:hypothetical protein